MKSEVRMQKEKQVTSFLLHSDFLLLTLSVSELI
jgi:hypothetical protein